ncbi:MAG TPA: DNA polymerase III subunit alpha, partial [Flavobacteriales bacterium]|nr:DNA polymerase III subunit alpha [Flavobacteriales bacterium]
NKRDHNTHRLLRTIAKNTVVSLLPAAEIASPEERFCTEEEVRRLYADAPHLVRNAEELLERCTIGFTKEDKTWKVFHGSAAEDVQRLRTDAYAGLMRRYPRAGGKEQLRLEKELDVITSMGFTSYFLINQDIVGFARSQGFFHVGRGSGANSLVAYCLGITDVDPMELDLYFERFISPARKKPPDFDIDFSWKDRDAVFKYVFDKYDETHTAQIATYTTFQWRGAIRELGKAMGLPPAEIDALSDGNSEHHKFRFEQPPATRANDLDRVAQLVVSYAQGLIGMPHQFGIHAGGIIISDAPMTAYTALHRLPKGFPVTQFSMLEAEDLGLHKFDLLSQRGLGHIREAVEILEKRGEHIDIRDIARFKQDPAIKELIRVGNTIGCFYVESPAMRMLLKKLRVDDYLGLVAASSIIRPGVAESGMMREYLLRHHDPELAKRNAPPKLLEIMKETYGVMVYQEDVIKVVVQYAGLNLEDADQVRRGMNIRYRDRPEFKAVEQKFFAN